VSISCVTLRMALRVIVNMLAGTKFDIEVAIGCYWYNSDHSEASAKFPNWQVLHNEFTSQMQGLFALKNAGPPKDHPQPLASQGGESSASKLQRTAAKRSKRCCPAGGEWATP
jgi:hypothetical protein